MNLTDEIFTDADKARAHLEATRWLHGAICPHCGTVGDATELQGRAHRAGVWQCNSCREQFTVTVGTVFERSKVPLNKWLLASFLMASSKKGVSAHQIHRTLGVTYKTAWFMCHRLREAMTAPADPAPMGGEGKVVEADETYVGGKEHDKHANKRLPHDLAWEQKRPVLTLVERKGHARSFQVASVTSKTLRTVIVKYADRKSHVMTDGHTSYPAIGTEFFAHSSVSHSDGEYVRGGFHHSNT